MKFNAADENDFKITFDDSELISQFDADGELYFDNTFEVNISDGVLEDGEMLPIENVDGEFGLIQVVHSGDYEHYSGSYNIVPKFSDQILSTNEKVMDDDVTVEKIQVSRVTNPQGGKTVYIGGIFNG